MRRQIDYHLAHARSAASSASPGARASIAASAEGLVRALQRLHAERGLRIEIDTPTLNAVKTIAGLAARTVGNCWSARLF